MAETLTFKVRGGGGAVFDLEVPPAGSQQLERFIERVNSGELTMLDSDGDPMDRHVVLAEIEGTVAVDEAKPFAMHDMTKAQLVAYAAEHDVDLGTAKTKDQILEALRAHEDDDD